MVRTIELVHLPYLSTLWPPSPPVVQPGSGKSTSYRNHVVECIRNVPKEFGDISPDYPVGRTTGVLFLRFLRHRGPSIIGSQLEISPSPPRVHPPAHRTSGPGLQPQHTAPHM